MGKSLIVGILPMQKTPKGKSNAVTKHGMHTRGCSITKRRVLATQQSIELAATTPRPVNSGHHARRQRLTALAEKHTLRNGPKEVLLEELDCVGADLVLEQKMDQELFTLLEHARDKITRLNRHLNYRHDNITELPEALQMDRGHVTRMCCQREGSDATAARMRAHLKMMQTTDMALREKCMTMDEELDDVREVAKGYDGMGEHAMLVSKGMQTMPEDLDVPSTEMACRWSAVATTRNVTESKKAHTKARTFDLADDDGAFVPSPESPIGPNELRASEDGIYQATSAAERGVRFGDLKEEIKVRGLQDMDETMRQTVLASYRQGA